MEEGRLRRFAPLALLMLLVAGILIVPLPAWGAAPQERHITVSARSFAFEPGTLRVNRGDTVVIRLESADVVHGLYVDGYGWRRLSRAGRASCALWPSAPAPSACAAPCGGNLHPFMIGKLVVGPNVTLLRAVLATLVTAVGGHHCGKGALTRPMTRYAISDIPLVKRLLRSRWPQWFVVAAMLLFFVLAILAGLFGTPAGNRNFGIVFVWIVWWALLILLMVPFAGRLWCGICPIPAPGEWLQRRVLVQPRPGGKLYTLGLKWPRRFRNIWLQNIGFLGVVPSTVILTTLLVTALVLAGFARRHRHRCCSSAAPSPLSLSGRRLIAVQPGCARRDSRPGSGCSRWAPRDSHRQQRWLRLPGWFFPVI